MKWFWKGVLLLLLFVTPNPAGGQDLHLGLRAGTSLSSLQGDTEDLVSRGHLELAPNLGPAFSGYLEIQGREWIASRLELKYVRKGASITGTSKPVCIAPPCPTFQIDETYRISYVEVPMLTTLRLPLGGALVPGIHLGQFLGFALDTDLPREGKFEDVKNTAYGLLVGATLGYSFESGEKLHLDVRYSRSLNTLSEGDDFRVDGVAVGVGYTFSSP